MARSREDRKTRNLMHHKQAGSLIREGQPRPVDLVEGNPVFRKIKGEIFEFVKHNGHVYKTKFRDFGDSDEDINIIIEFLGGMIGGTKKYGNEVALESGLKQDTFWIRPKEFLDKAKNISVFRLTGEQNSDHLDPVENKYFVLNELHLKQKDDTSWNGGSYFIYAHTDDDPGVDTETTAAFSVNDVGDIVCRDISATGNINGSAIWHEWIFNTFRGVANRYYYRDQDDLDDWRRWDAYSTLDGSGDIVITTQFVSGHFVVPENCTLVAMHGQIYNAGSTSCPTVSVFSGTPSDSSSLTASSRGNTQPNSGSALTSNQNYTFNKIDFDYDLTRGDIVLPTIHYGAGSLQSFIGCLTLKFVTR